MISRRAIEVVTVLIINMLYRIFHAVLRLSAGHFDSVVFRAFTSIFRSGQSRLYTGLGGEGEELPINVFQKYNIANILVHFGGRVASILPESNNHWEIIPNICHFSLSFGQDRLDCRF